MERCIELVKPQLNTVQSWQKTLEDNTHERLSDMFESERLRYETLKREKEEQQEERHNIEKTTQNTAELLECLKKQMEARKAKLGSRWTFVISITGLIITAAAFLNDLGFITLRFQNK